MLKDSKVECGGDQSKKSVRREKRESSKERSNIGATK